MHAACSHQCIPTPFSLSLFFFSPFPFFYSEWLDAIYHHRFVLAPFGHGLDTHRISEIYGNGGIPVMRRSTISSCYDDSDNDMGKGRKRGSLPLVIVDKWEDLSEEFLEKEWLRIVKIPIEAWDYHRLLLSHWIDRIQNVGRPAL